MSKTKRNIFKGVSLVLAFILAICPISLLIPSNATEEATEILVEEIINIIWDTLRAWGVRILHDNGYDGNVREWIWQKWNEYSEQELHQSFNVWLNGMDFVIDNFGRMAGNTTFLVAINTFAHWLQNELGWSDNTVYTYGDTYEINGLTVYTLPLMVLVNETGQGAYQGWTNYWYDGNTPIYIVFQDDPSVTAYAFCSSSFTMYSDAYNANNENVSTKTTTGNATSRIYGLTTSNSNWVSTSVSKTGIDLIANGFVSYSYDEIIAALKTDSLLPGDPIEVEVGTQDYPPLPSDPDYVDGMSIIYYPDGTIGYLQLDWPDSVSVDNLPAIVSTGRISNLDVSSVTLPFSSFVSMMGDGLDLITDIIYNFPSAIVAFALAIISATIVFGVIKVLKEH